MTLNFELWPDNVKCLPMGYEISSRKTHPMNPGRRAGFQNINDLRFAKITNLNTLSSRLTIRLEACSFLATDAKSQI